MSRTFCLRGADIMVVFSDLRASLNGRDLPEEDKTRMLNMHEKIVRLEEEQRTTKEQLLRARAVCCECCSRPLSLNQRLAVYQKSR